MKFRVLKSDDYKYREEVEINTLEELEELWAKYGYDPLIVDFYTKDIEIYNDYRE